MDRRGRFRSGVLVGAALASLLWGAVLAATLVWVQVRGVRVDVNLDGMASAVREEVGRHVSEAVPAFVEQAKREVPDRVRAEIAGSMAGTTLAIGDVAVPIPEAMARAFEARLQAQVETVLYQILDEVDYEALAEELADRAYVMVRRDLAGRTGPQVFVVTPMPGLPWLALPVTLVLR